MGRPRKNNGKSITKSFRLTVRDAVFLENYCLDHNVSISDVFLAALAGLRKDG